jgi:hypothetical protein
MSVVGTVSVRCPACGVEQEVRLVQSLNTRDDPGAKRRLLAGELDVLACACGRRTPLAADLLYSDPEHDLLVRVCPGDAAARAEAAELFRAAGATGTQRVVPAMNALIEKIKVTDAGLEDWAIEMTKVLLLASDGDFARTLWFERIDRDGAVLHWILVEPGGAARPVASKLDAYERIAARASSRPGPDERQIDRAWALAAVQQMVEAGN